MIMRDFKIRLDGPVKGTTGFYTHKKNKPGANKCGIVLSRPVIPMQIKSWMFVGFSNVKGRVYVDVQITWLFCLLCKFW